MPRRASAVAVGFMVAAAASLFATLSAEGSSRVHRQAQHHTVKSKSGPLQIADGQYEPITWTDVPGWTNDNLWPAFFAFLSSCKASAASRNPGGAPKILGRSLDDVCAAARHATVDTGTDARAFFEMQFRPVKIARLGDADGFVTGYYEPVFDGSLVRTDDYTVPVYRRPSNLYVRGARGKTADFPNKGKVFRKIGRRKLVPYFDRAEIEDGALEGRGLEICWLKSQIDLLFMQIQGSARIRLPDGEMLRLNYDAHNGYPYLPVGRVLIDRGIVPKEEMSMQRIRDWMEANPDAANEVRRQNRSYVFFRKVDLTDSDEPIGAQGLPLTPGRSIAVDKNLHLYGTPFFISAKLPIASDVEKTSFAHLMVAQDTGSAIVGLARADIYFGTGAEAGRISGRLRHNALFTMLIPKSVDPVVAGFSMPLPHARPSALIARLLSQKRSAPAKAGPAKPNPAKPDTAKPDTAKTPGISHKASQ